MDHQLRSKQYYPIVVIKIYVQHLGFHGTSQNRTKLHCIKGLARKYPLLRSPRPAGSYFSKRYKRRGSYMLTRNKGWYHSRRSTIRRQRSCYWRKFCIVEEPCWSSRFWEGND